MNNPTFTIFCGVNGAGKTTLHNFLRGEEDTHTFLNSDNLVAELNYDWRNFMQNVQAGRIVLERMMDNFRDKKSFSLETTNLSYSVEKYIRVAKQQGYFVEIYFVGIDNVDILVDRVNSRIEKGGHGVSDRLVKAKFKRQFEAIPHFIDIVDRTILYNNKNQLTVAGIFGKTIFVDEKVPWAKKIKEEYEKNKASTRQKES